MSLPNYDIEEPRPSKVPQINLAARLVTFASLAITMVVLQTNRVTFTDSKNDKFRLTYNSYHTYEYTFYVSTVGLIYSAVQAPFAGFYVIVKRRVFNSDTLLRLEFYCDKLVTLLLGLAAGASFSVTKELKEHALEKRIQLNAVL
ncbi:CASP-like protein 4D1 [Coffea eugenioides]|uniref:CASP-like protein 4D1 n=1 Tax=Coffea eugenioides TaxID=49369 RepID=UPI000F610D03|nr:CASP-like protein 4D1 [Coffea eugenioides]